MRLEVPFFSQYYDEVPRGWQKSSCSIICVQMILAYHDTIISVKELIEEGKDIGGFPWWSGPKNGWKHDSLVMLLRNHGLACFREEFRSRDVNFAALLKEYGAKKFVKYIDLGEPVQASVKFPHMKGYHMVLFTGYEMEGENIKGFYYHDSAKKTEEEGMNIFVSKEDFMKGWRGMAIFPSKI